MKIIAITGMPGSGKETIRKELEKKGFSMFVMRHVVEDELREKGIEPTNTSLREYATEMRKKQGYDIVARRSFEKLKQMNEEIVILDGIRGDMEIEFFRKQNVQFILIAAASSSKTRFERLSKRGREWDMKTKEEFEYRDNKEIGWGLEKAIEMADYSIENEGTLEEFKKKVHELVEKILAES